MQFVILFGLLLAWFCGSTFNSKLDIQNLFNIMQFSSLESLNIVDQILNIKPMSQMMKFLNHAPNIPTSLELDYLKYINLVVNNMNHNQLYLNGIYRDHLMALLQIVFKMSTTKKISSQFARQISVALLVTNITKFEHLYYIHQLGRWTPTDKMYKLSIEVFIEMYEENFMIDGDYYEQAIEALTGTYQYQYLLIDLKNDTEKLINYKRHGMILWSDGEITIIRNMINKAARYHGCRTSTLVRKMFDSLNLTLRTLWKAIWRARSSSIIYGISALHHDKHIQEIYYLSDDKGYMNRFDFKTKLAIAIMTELTKLGKLAPDLMIRNSIAIHWAKILWQLKPFREYLRFIASDALFDPDMLVILINTFRCNEFRDLKYLAEIINVVIEIRQDWDFVGALELTAQHELIEVGEILLSTSF